MMILVMDLVTTMIKIDSQLLGNSMKYIGICQQVFAKLFATGMVFFDGIKYLWIIFFKEKKYVVISPNFNFFFIEYIYI